MTNGTLIVLDKIFIQIKNLSRNPEIMSRPDEGRHRSLLRARIGSHDCEWPNFLAAGKGQRSFICGLRAGVDYRAGNIGGDPGLIKALPDPAGSKAPPGERARPHFGIGPVINISSCLHLFHQRNNIWRAFARPPLFSQFARQITGQFF